MIAGRKPRSEAKPSEVTIARPQAAQRSGAERSHDRKAAGRAAVHKRCRDE
jgi:hypothetical protein